VSGGVVTSNSSYRSCHGDCVLSKQNNFDINFLSTKVQYASFDLSTHITSNKTNLSSAMMVSSSENVAGRRRLWFLVFCFLNVVPIVCGFRLIPLQPTEVSPWKSTPVKETVSLGYGSHRASRTTSLYSTSSMTFKNFDRMLEAFRGEPVLIYFSSKICGPCQLQRKELATVRTMLDSSNSAFIKVLTIDANSFPQVGVRYSVTKLPCLLFIKDGEVLLRLEGLTKAEDLINLYRAKVDQYI
jgi:thioredoxin 1